MKTSTSNSNSLIHEIRDMMVMMKQIEPIDSNDKPYHKSYSKTNPMSINIVIWNANGLSKHSLENQSFLFSNNVDILLVSETHFTSRSNFWITNYKIYSTYHPDESAHGGTAILIKSSLSHLEMPKYQTNENQATSIQVDDHCGKVIFSALYSPPKHNIK